MPEQFSDPGFDFPQNRSVPTREELIYLLSCASELEHELACSCFFVAHSLKNDTSEGGLTEAQAGLVRGWRRNLFGLANERMQHLLQISNLLAAIGATPYLVRPTFSTSSSVEDSKAGLALEPFSQLTIKRLLEYEEPDAIIMTAEQQLNIRLQFFPAPSLGDDSQPLTTIETKDTTLGKLYTNIEEGFRQIAAEELFVGSAELQANFQFLDSENQLITVTDQQSAQAALLLIFEAAEGTTSTAYNKRAAILNNILKEYATVSEDAQQTSSQFDPVRPIGENPRISSHSKSVDSTWLVEPNTVAVALLFNKAYDTMLFLLQNLFGTTRESEENLEPLARAAVRLLNSVVRPLSEALTWMPADSSSLVGRRAGPSFDVSNSPSNFGHQTATRAIFDELLWQLALEATKLGPLPDLPIEVREATAALQELSCQFAPADGPHNGAARVKVFKQLQAEMGCGIISAINGPYIATNVSNFVNWLGERMNALPQMALCRCGESALKPFCDGTHARLDFISQKDPKRVPNHRESYAGTTVRVFDNRGACAHSGFCTDRLSGVFRQGEEPFVVPNGARMDEIIRAVRACPSGALSYALGSVEVRAVVDQEREPTIEVSKDGPYRITGGIPLKDGQGQDEARNEGASLEHYSLCRCGHSQNKPFCSGMHWYVNFHDPEIANDQEPTIFEWIGGLPALLRMTELFYSKYVPQEPLLRPLFGHMSSDHPEKVAAWLGEVFGGPKNYSGPYGGYTRMISQHIGKAITEPQRARWATLMCQAADEAGIPMDPEARSAFVSYIEWGTRLAVENSASDAHPPPHMPMPRWNWGTAGAPGSRVSALAPIAEQEEQLVLPSKEETVRFSQHIKPLFRQMDRQSMKWAFDLWSSKDVAAQASEILQRLKNGTMPCDGAWSEEKVTLFERWVESGMQE